MVPLSQAINQKSPRESFQWNRREIPSSTSIPRSRCGISPADPPGAAFFFTGVLHRAAIQTPLRFPHIPGLARLAPSFSPRDRLRRLLSVTRTVYVPLYFLLGFPPFRRMKLVRAVATSTCPFPVSLIFPHQVPNKVASFHLPLPPSKSARTMFPPPSERIAPMSERMWSLKRAYLLPYLFFSHPPREKN